MGPTSPCTWGWVDSLNDTPSDGDVPRLRFLDDVAVGMTIWVEPHQVTLNRWTSGEER